MTKRKCEVCGKREATRTDRRTPGRLLKRICEQCHKARLRKKNPKPPPDG